MMVPSHFRGHRALIHPAGFTLVEVLVATAVMLIVILVLFQVIAGMTNLWHSSTGTVSNFQSARAAFTVINRQLARATLKTYLDYVDSSNVPFGQFRSSLTTAQQASFVPSRFARASDLHFISGPASQILPSGAAAITNPGDAIFFQAPLGIVGGSNASSDQFLAQALNDVGFFVQYSDLNLGGLAGFFGHATHYRFRLVECAEPAESLTVYSSSINSTGSYTNAWLPPASAAMFPVPASSTTYSESVLAEDVVLLLFRPRLEAQDEQVLAPLVSTGTYSSTTANSIISPNYAYDSDAWQPGYTFSATSVTTKNYALYMRNQLPSIVDVAMVCIDPAAVERLNLASLATPPAALQPASGLFTNSANLDTDLNTFGQQLSANHIRYRVFRSSVQIEGAAWANN